MNNNTSQDDIVSPQKSTRPLQVNRLLIGFIQIQDEAKTVRLLNELGLNPIRFSSIGAFLGRRNVTLLVGMNDTQVNAAINIIQQSCHQRTEYVSTPLEGAPLPMPLSTPITIGGATILIFDVERFEEL